MSVLQPNDWVRSLSPYVPGRASAEGVERVVKLSANESAFGPSPAAIAAYRAAADRLERYPDPDASALRHAIAAQHGLDPARVICGAGSDEILHLVAQAFLKPGDEVIHSRYGFMLYGILAHEFDCPAVAVQNRDWAADVDGMLAAVTDRTRMVFLDNPNNPTGACLPASEVARLYAGLPDDCVLVYDAAYAECVTDADYTDGATLALDSDNVLVTRTFSKMYGLAALRIGWGYGSQVIIDALNRIRMPFNANTPAQEAALAALDDQAHLASVRDRTVAERKALAAELMAMGLETAPSETNFLLIRFPEAAGVTAEEANAWLAARGYLLRWLPGQGLVGCLRLTVGETADNRAVIALLQEFMDGR